jgi:hypothetical protein
MEESQLNGIIVDYALSIVTVPLSNLVYEKLKKVYRDNWWKKGVLYALNEDTRINLPKVGEDLDLKSNLDIAIITRIVAEKHWTNIFSKIGDQRLRTYIRELRDIRNFYSHAHRGSKKVLNADLNRSLDTMIRILDMIDQKSGVIEKLKRLMTNKESIYSYIQSNEKLVKKINPQNKETINISTISGFKLFGNTVTNKDSLLYVDEKVLTLVDIFYALIIREMNDLDYKIRVGENEIISWIKTNKNRAETIIHSAQNTLMYEDIIQMEGFIPILKIIRNKFTMVTPNLVETAFKNIINESYEVRQEIVNRFEKDWLKIHFFIRDQMTRFLGVTFDKTNRIKGLTLERNTCDLKKLHLSLEQLGLLKNV